MRLEADPTSWRAIADVATTEIERLALLAGHGPEVDDGDGAAGIRQPLRPGAAQVVEGGLLQGSWITGRPSWKYVGVKGAHSTPSQRQRARSPVGWTS